MYGLEEIIRMNRAAAFKEMQEAFEAGAIEKAHRIWDVALTDAVQAALDKAGSTPPPSGLGGQ